MPARSSAIGFTIATGVTIGFFWFTDVPLGVPGEWTWNRILSLNATGVDGLLGILLGLFAAGCLIGVSCLGASRIGRARPRERVVWLATLVLSGFGWLLVIQDCAPAPYGLARSPWVIYYPGMSGYHAFARDRIRSMDQFLSEYDTVLTDPDPNNRTLHLGTHPPGLFLLHHGLITICETFEGLTRQLTATQPQSVRDALRTISPDGRPVPEPDKAALWLAALLTQLAAVATVLPLYALIRVDLPAQIAWRSVVFWPLVPALIIFLPKSDCLFPFLATTAIWLGWSGLMRGGWWRLFLAGLTLWLGLCLSLAFLPVVLLGAGLLAWHAFKIDTTGTPHHRFLVALASTMSGLAIPTVACWLTWEVNLPRIWWVNLENHAGFYELNPRTFFTWLLVNPLELILSLGIPLSLLAVSGSRRRLASGDPCQTGPVWTCLLVWCGLWLSGKNMGEAARLWLFLMPWACWLAAPCWADTDTASTGRRRWLWGLAFQGIVVVATVTRVTGFHFPQLTPGL